MSALTLKHKNQSITQNNLSKTLPKYDILDFKDLENSYNINSFMNWSEKSVNSQKIIVNGVVSLFDQGKYNITIQTSEGEINAILNDPNLLQAIKNFHNKEATVYGKGHFNSDGSLSFIEIERILKPKPIDKYFSKIPNAETAKQQIERQMAEKPYVNWMEKIAGLWPGNETDEEFEQLIKDFK